jgi:hypothetical protein
MAVHEFDSIAREDTISCVVIVDAVASFAFLEILMRVQAIWMIFLLSCG